MKKASRFLTDLALLALCLTGAAAARAQFTTLTSLPNETTLTQSGNTLYGVTDYGGADGYGAVYSLPTSGGTPTLLGSFDNTTNGAYPFGNLFLSGNTLYGTAGGEIFSLPVTGGRPTALIVLPERVTGLTLVGNTFYGISTNESEDYTIFSLPLTGGTPTTLATFKLYDQVNPDLLVSGNDGSPQGCA